MFVGINIDFLSDASHRADGHAAAGLHLSGRDMGWDWPNLFSTVGAFMIAAGVLLFLVDLAAQLSASPGGQRRQCLASRHARMAADRRFIRHPQHPVGDRAASRCGTIRISPKQVERGRYFLPGTCTGGRETLVTSAVEAVPQYVLQVPGPSWRSFFAAVFTAAFFLLLTVKLVAPALVCGVLALVMILVWMWQTDPGITHAEMHIGRGMKLPVYVTGPMSHSWWAMAVVLLVAASLFIALVFSYLYIWTVAPEHWPPASGLRLPPVHWSLASALAFLLSGAAVALAGRLLAMVRKYGHWPARLSLAFGSLALAAALAIDFTATGNLDCALAPAVTRRWCTLSSL